MNNILTPHNVAIVSAMLLPMAIYASAVLAQRFADFNDRRRLRRRAHAHNH